MSVTKINRNQTYTYNGKKVSPDAPSYIKIVDGSHYVAIPNLEMRDDSNQAFGITFVQGVYTKKHDDFKLGKNAQKTELWFDSYDDFKDGRYTISKSRQIKLKKTVPPFEEGKLTKKKGIYYYKSNRINTYSLKKKFLYLRLRKAKINLPTTEKEFIRQYHQKQ
ncbi:hypothetical protein LFYK43_04760 [Ligilactobacillus salitolerans]|uniref:Uncharacterized protein n=1 Tax=Ligilactobacillus salitolerans TaxID=1808352 RepID=A0A401IR77_9LACO|nr:hypothetical protein LFYK43_04760 [Ligilactobacillus salitolerans]